MLNKQLFSARFFEDKGTVSGYLIYGDNDNNNNNNNNNSNNII